MIKAVIFDLDGVLIDSEPVYMEHNFLKIQKYIPELQKEVLMPTVGMSTKMCDSFIADLLGLQVDSEEYKKYRQQVNQDLSIDYKAIMRKNAVETLAKIDQLGYRIALASSGDYKEIIMILQECEILDYFEVICSGDMFKQAKPNPEIYLTTFNKLNLQAKQCLVVEDSQVGLTAAIKSGAHVCCMKETRFNFTQEGAEYYIDDLNQLITILQDNY